MARGNGKKQTKGSVREVMTTDPVTMPGGASALDAARQMRDVGIGDVIVLENDRIAGILTDRDIVVRVVAEERDPEDTRLAEVCSRELTTLSPDDGIDRAIEMMRAKAIRRVPVVKDGRPVGIVSLGDLAVDRDPKSVLAEISAAPPNE
jgi:CBS domain-containing protein